jgi:hypothetical protein
MTVMGVAKRNWMRARFPVGTTASVRHMEEEQKIKKNN